MDEKVCFSISGFISLLDRCEGDANLFLIISSILLNLSLHQVRFQVAIPKLRLHLNLLTLKPDISQYKKTLAEKLKERVPDALSINNVPVINLNNKYPN